MSDETASFPDDSPVPSAENAPRVRRISNPRPKKSSKAASPENSVSAGEGEVPVPEREGHSDSPPHVGSDWPEPEAESAGGNPLLTESTKRKRRRRKGKSAPGGPQHASGAADDEVIAANISEAKSPESPQENRPRQNPAPLPQRPKVDPELLTKMAWKIYLAEVSEEGVALIGDSDAKDLSRRCFRLAEIFIEEQNRRR